MRINLEDFAVDTWTRIAKGEVRPEFLEVYYKNDRVTIALKKRIEFRTPPMEMWDIVGKKLGLDWEYDFSFNRTSVRIVQIG